jgi:type IV fimbrial biogenesis protein FimT
MTTPWRGVTLVELLVAISIAGILLTAAMPAMHDLVRASRLDASARQLHGHIQLARTAAVQFRRISTLCPRDGRADAGGARCGTDWGRGYMVFIDADGDAVRDLPGDTLLADVPASPGVHVNWRAFRRREALQFRADGATQLSNGTFTLCTVDAGVTADDAEDGDAVPTATRVVRLVINVGGRTRTERRGDPEALCD